ncbi:hypothetical protein [Neisseria chenwenguii]|uniref:hypothetical protein n=1 Tax=Neisseria chenwenguii TaxID=1853278 RepID=UPI000F4ED698|nr:hypothetical protein [Neisseria chenwenguii]ROV56002.1 hypothetical protein EGS38_07375 [Neisseria chenwenguii]
MQSEKYVECVGRLFLRVSVSGNKKGRLKKQIRQTGVAALRDKIYEDKNGTSAKAKRPSEKSCRFSKSPNHLF